MKKAFLFLLLAALCLTLAVPACAVDKTRSYIFELTSNGESQINANTGDIITVLFTLRRSDGGGKDTMYAMQNEMRYDPSFFRYVEGSAMLTAGIELSHITGRGAQEVYMNYLSLNGGTPWDADVSVGSFQLEVIATGGVSTVCCDDYLVSTQDGRDAFAATAVDLTVVLSTDCTVTFITNGGTELAPVSAYYGERLTRPEDPIREGYRLEGWYKDLDLTEPWDFETDTVKGNMSLYAKWVPGKANGTGIGGNHFPWYLLLALIPLVALLLFLLLGKKKVVFHSQGGSPVEAILVKRGAKLTPPLPPSYPGRIFAGWYTDAACTDAWVFEFDTVRKNMTLYARWK